MFNALSYNFCLLPRNSLFSLGKVKTFMYKVFKVVKLLYDYSTSQLVRALYIYPSWNLPVSMALMYSCRWVGLIFDRSIYKTTTWSHSSFYNSLQCSDIIESILSGENSPCDYEQYQNCKYLHHKPPITSDGLHIPRELVLSTHNIFFYISSVLIDSAI